MFNEQNIYLFGFNYNGGYPNEVIAQKPTSIEEDRVLFHFSYGHHSLSEFVKKEEILAVGNNQKGTVRISGWSGKFEILNHQKFDELVSNGVIKLKE